MNIDEAALDFAYRYPFSEEGRRVVMAANPTTVEQKYLKAGKLRVEEALNSKRIEFVKTNYSELRLTYVMSYAYARMLISAMGNLALVGRYVAAEGVRARAALSADTAHNVARLAQELGLDILEADNDFAIRFEKYLSFAAGEPSLALVHQNLEKGFVYLSRDKLLTLMGEAVEKAVGKALPIPAKELPRDVTDAVKTIKYTPPKVDTGASRVRYEWIEKLLATPIPDVRHRTINLILAPYLTTIKGLDDSEAARIIMDYIESCKRINPDTRVNESYIRYQCKYAKGKGMRPLSQSKAKDLLKSIVDVEALGV